MKTPFPLLLGLALAGQTAWSAESLMLRLKQTNTSGASDYSLVYAKRGEFAATPNPLQTNASDLYVVGRDSAGRELFRSRVRDPGKLHAEAFDPASKHIAFAREIQRPTAYFEVNVPSDKTLDHIELLPAQGISTKTTAQSVTRRIDRKQIDDALSHIMPMAVTHAATTTMLYQSGPSSNRMDIVLIGDGYTAAEMGKWATDAQKVANGLLADPLYAANKAGINIRRVDIASNQSGVDEPLRNITRDTALGMVVGCYGVDRLVCADENLVFNAVDSVLAADAHDVIVAVANTTTYGGAGGDIATMTMHAQAIELALHEIGHTAFKLADEYDYGSCDASHEPTEANVTTDYRRTNAKWAASSPAMCRCLRPMATTRRARWAPSSAHATAPAACTAPPRIRACARWASPGMP